MRKRFVGLELLETVDLEIFRTYQRMTFPQQTHLLHHNKANPNIIKDGQVILHLAEEKSRTNFYS